MGVATCTGGDGVLGVNGEGGEVGSVISITVYKNNSTAFSMVILYTCTLLHTHTKNSMVIHVHGCVGRDD